MWGSYRPWSTAICCDDVGCTIRMRALSSVVVAVGETHLSDPAILGKLSQTTPMQSRQISRQKPDRRWSVRCYGTGAILPSWQQLSVICWSSLAEWGTTQTGCSRRWHCMIITCPTYCMRCNCVGSSATKNRATRTSSILL